MRIKSSLYIALLLGLLLTACGHDRVFHQSHSVALQGWHSDEKIRFQIDIQDTTLRYDLYFTVRNSVEYEWMNLFIFLKTYYPDLSFSKDTIECFFANPDGTWLGKGSRNIKDNFILFKQGVQFPNKGSYVFEIEHGMRQNPLLNIQDIGLTVYKSSTL